MDSLKELSLEEENSTRNFIQGATKPRGAEQVIPADLIGGGPCKQSPKCTPGWAALPLPPQGQWTVVGHGRTQDGDTGGPWEDPEEGDTGRLWEDPGRGHWRAVGGPGTGTLAGRGRTRGRGTLADCGRTWGGDTGGLWEDPGRGTLAGHGRTPGRCRADHGAGVVLGGWGRFRGRRCGSGLSPCVSSALEWGAVLDPDYMATTTAPAALTHTRDHTGSDQVTQCSTGLHSVPHISL